MIFLITIVAISKLLVNSQILKSKLYSCECTLNMNLNMSNDFQNALHKFPKVLIRGICLTIKRFFSC